MSVTLVTSHGDIKLELFIDQAPKTCLNFLALCASSNQYYSGCEVVRNIKGFLWQTGDPSNTGKGGKHSIFSPDPMPREVSPNLRHDKRGVVSMASLNSSQFFITYSAQPSFDDNYNIFARVIDGWDCLSEMEKVSVDEKFRPVEKITLDSIIIHSNPFADRNDYLQL